MTRLKEPFIQAVGWLVLPLFALFLGCLERLGRRL